MYESTHFKLAPTQPLCTYFATFDTVIMSETIFPESYGVVGRKEPFPGQRPLTPWRSTFGGYNHPDFANTGRSGLRPIHPRLAGQPWVSRYPEPLRSPLEQPDNGSLDELFLSERFQTQSCAGLRSWQLPSINLGVNDDHPFTVNESTWHHVFQKSHWFDYRSPWEMEMGGSTPYWSVDNDAFWDEIKIPLEMANRIFNVLIRTRW
jgi:hypothetical protein